MRWEKPRDTPPTVKPTALPIICPICFNQRCKGSAYGLQMSTLPNSEQISTLSPILANSYLLISFFFIFPAQTFFFLSFFCYENPNTMCSGQTVPKLLQSVASHSNQVQVCLLLHCFQWHFKQALKYGHISHPCKGIAPRTALENYIKSTGTDKY